MASVKIITDSTADIPFSLVRELGIEVVPFYINIGQESYRAGIDITNEQFYRTFNNEEVHPTVTAPQTIAFEQTYRRLAQQHETIISIHLSSHLSTTYTAAAQARERLPISMARIDVIDSQSVSMGMGLTVIAAARMAKAGAPVHDILREVQHRIQHTHSAFFVDTIEHLERSGRINIPPHMLGSMSRIKPLMLINDGQIIPYERTRTRAKAIDGLFTFIEDFPGVNEVAITHSTTPEDVEKLLDKLMPIYPRERVLITEYGPATGVHLGPGAMGIAAYEGSFEISQF
jgi:DegV family protein with EDD domain